MDRGCRVSKVSATRIFLIKPGEPPGQGRQGSRFYRVLGQFRRKLPLPHQSPDPVDAM